MRTVSAAAIVVVAASEVEASAIAASEVAAWKAKPSKPAPGSRDSSSTKIDGTAKTRED